MSFMISMLRKKLTVTLGYTHDANPYRIAKTMAPPTLDAPNMAQTRTQLIRHIGTRVFMGPIRSARLRK